MSPKRTGFTLFQLLVILAVLALLVALFLPALAKMRAQAERAEAQNNLKQIGLACHNYQSTFNMLPPGVDTRGFSAFAYLLPYVEREEVYKAIDFQKPLDDEANKKAAATVIKNFLDPKDPVTEVSKDFGGTNYQFSAGSNPDLKDNNGVFYRNSKCSIARIPDGTSSTLLTGQTLKGDAGMKALDVHRQHVLLTKESLKNLKDEAGVQEFKDDKMIAADRGKSWMDGRFLQTIFTGTRTLNDEKPDVDCGGVGGLSGLRGLTNGNNIGMCDGSVRFITNKVSLKTWKLLANKADGEIITEDF